MPLKVNKETVVAEIEVDDRNKTVVSYIDSNFGKYVSIQDMYIRRDKPEEGWQRGKANGLNRNMQNW
jgi:hypothetical protein